MNRFIFFPALITILLLFSCGQKKAVDSNLKTDSTSNQNTLPVNENSIDRNYQGEELDKSKYPDDLYVVMPSKVTSSGYLTGKNEDYRDDFMIDHDPFTWWTPNPNRDGQGAWIELQFDQEIPMEGFEIWGGSHNPEYPKYGDIYKLNNRVKKGVCEFSDGTSLNFELKDVDNWQWVKFDTTIKTKSIRLKINEVYKGEKWEDLCIAEFLALTSDKNLAYYGEEMAKPVIYIYPEKKTDVIVKLDTKNMNGTLDISYPDYSSNGWSVTAHPDGKLIDKKTGKTHNYLFWEGTSLKQWKFDEGFVVKGNESASFLEEKLSQMGLTDSESNDFIVYWLPQMAKNKYNLVKFVNEEYNKDIPLNIQPKPESILRVYMIFKSIDSPVNIPEQKLKSFQRKGFTVIEWGGSQIDNQNTILF